MTDFEISVKYQVEKLQDAIRKKLQAGGIVILTGKDAASAITLILEEVGGKRLEPNYVDTEIVEDHAIIPLKCVDYNGDWHTDVKRELAQLHEFIES